MPNGLAGRGRNRRGVSQLGERCLGAATGVRPGTQHDARHYGTDSEDLEELGLQRSNELGDGLLLGLGPQLTTSPS